MVLLVIPPITTWVRHCLSYFAVSLTGLSRVNREPRPPFYQENFGVNSKHTMRPCELCRCFMFSLISRVDCGQLILVGDKLACSRRGIFMSAF